MTIGWHCDLDSCDSWTRHGYKHGFLKIKDGPSSELHFCSWDCILKFSAKFDPVQVITDQ